MNRAIRYFLALAAFLATARQSMGNSTAVTCEDVRDIPAAQIVDQGAPPPSPIPEPTSVAILLIGVASVLTRRRRTND